MDQFSQEKLLSILKDVKNMNQNVFFISIFPKEIVDLAWSNRYELSDLEMLFLIAFSVEGSNPSKVRKGWSCWENSFLPEPNTLLLDVNLIEAPSGVISQLVMALSIENLIFITDAALRITFDLDFSLIANQIKSCFFHNINSDYQLNTLYSSKSIETLTFNNVQGEILPKDLTLATALSSVEFRLCKLNQLPKINKNNSKLTKIVFNESIKLTKINLDFFPQSIQELDFSMNKLNEIKGISGFDNLEKLDLSSCFFTSFDFSELPRTLKRLNLRDNEITTFPQEMNIMCQNLEYLDISHNHISSIPMELLNLNSLSEFLCSHNKLEILPEGELFWRGISRLDSRKNQLRKLPASMKNLTNLVYLDLEDNCLTEFLSFYETSDLSRTTIRLRGNFFSIEEKHKLLSLETSYLDL